MTAGRESDFDRSITASLRGGAGGLRGCWCARSVRVASR
jgi:hypothetical protein